MRKELRDEVLPNYKMKNNIKEVYNESELKLEQDKVKDKEALEGEYKSDEEVNENIYDFSKLFEPIRESFEKISIFSANVGRIINNDEMKKAFNVFGEVVNNLSLRMGEIFENSIKSLEDLNPRVKDVILLLTTRGWYFDIEMSITWLWQIQEHLEEENFEEIDTFLVEYFEDKVDQIESEITQKYPEREKIITSAFNAYRNNSFELSIPVLLSQIDGICYERIKHYYFMKKNKKPQTAQFLTQFDRESIIVAFSSPLENVTYIADNYNQDNVQGNELNRHMIMHGISYDYGSKINNLKVISMLNYISQMLDLLCAECKEE